MLNRQKYLNACYFGFEDTERKNRLHKLCMVEPLRPCANMKMMALWTDYYFRWDRSVMPRFNFTLAPSEWIWEKIFSLEDYKQKFNRLIATEENENAKAAQAQKAGGSLTVAIGSRSRQLVDPEAMINSLLEKIKNLEAEKSICEMELKHTKRILLEGNLDSPDALQNPFGEASTQTQNPKALLSQLKFERAINSSLHDDLVQLLRNGF